MRRGNGSLRSLGRVGSGPAEAWDEPLERAFERLVRDPRRVARGPARLISAEEIRWERCTYCERPARSSIFDLARRERILLCGACRPAAGRSVDPDLGTAPGPGSPPSTRGR